jgi:hypothetical protein
MALGLGLQRTGVPQFHLSELRNARTGVAHPCRYASGWSDGAVLPSASASEASFSRITKLPDTLALPSQGGNSARERPPPFVSPCE